jgi:hypothetical protein
MQLRFQVCLLFIIKTKLLKEDINMVNKKSWKQFRESGLLWWINTTLHMFGWAIVVEIDNESGEINNAYPARVKFRGFNEINNTEGYQKVTKFLKDNIEDLELETLD